jgi:hypothetical protein
LSILDELDLSAIQDERARQGIVLLLNLVEQLKRENTELRAQVQRLRDEINRLKGEQPKPKIQGNTPKPPPSTPTNYSSESQRRTPKEWTKAKKSQTIRIDREETLELDRAVLPEDAEFKGHEDVIVQDIVFGTDNVRFHKEKFYSPGQHRTYLASLPDSYEGQFGPTLKALTVALYFGANVSEPKIVELYRDVGVSISAGELSNLLIKAQESFHAEKAALVEAGLASSPWQHLDETGTRVNGQNQHCQILCNPLYTAYQTTESKGRLSTLDVLRLGRPREYLYNAEAKSLLAGVLSGVTQKQLSKLPEDERLDEPTMTRLLTERMGNLGVQQRKWLLDAMAVAAYHAEESFPVVKLLVCDDAPQFTWLSAQLALCWVHEARRYNLLLPSLAPAQRLLAEFMDRFWLYYRELLAYREQPSEPERERLSAKFDEVFSSETKTGYWDLDDRIARTRVKKRELLMVLEHPEIPLHNNPAEWGARQRVRKRDVSFGPRVRDGTRAWDTFQTLAATAAKLGVSFYAYIHDRISKSFRLSGLDSLIAARAKELNLGASWTGP